MKRFARWAALGLILGSPLPVAAQDTASPETAQALSASSDFAQIARACRGRLPPGAGYPRDALTPVTVRVIQPIIPVPATDGSIHLSFAAEVTNVSSFPSSVTSITPVDPLGGYQPSGFNSVLDADGRDITNKIRLFGTGVDSAELPPGAAGITFFDVRYRLAADLPRLLALQIATTTSSKSGPVTLNLPSDPLVVSCDPPPVLRPPLVGSGWWNGNGCCNIVGPHRGATLPINGNIHAPESFGIDYVQLNASNSCCTSGPIHDLASWPFYGAPILAVADGIVVEMENSLPEQIPAQPPVGVTVTNAAGNDIIESIQGGRYFVLYAHLKTGSIPSQIKVGTRIRAGQQIGQLGNSGSTTAPHLHFQVMDRPSALNANGVPFVFTTQQLQGIVQGTLAAADEAYETGKPVSVNRAVASWRAFQMPAETHVFGYNLK